MHYSCCTFNVSESQVDDFFESTVVVLIILTLEIPAITGNEACVTVLLPNFKQQHGR